MNVLKTSKEITKISLALLVIMIFANCYKHVSVDEQKFNEILGELNQILDKKEAVAKELSSKRNLLTAETLNEFPSNRETFGKAATEKIALYNKIADLDKEQIEKLDRMSRLTLDSGLRSRVEVQRQIHEASIEDTNMSIEKLQSFLDKQILTNDQLREKILPLEQKQVLIREKRDELELRRRALEKEDK